MQQRPLGTRSGEARMFSTADTAIKLLRELGIYHADLDVTHYEAGSLRPGRPDTAKKNRAAHEALEHDRWFRTQVQEALDKMENNTAEFIDHDTMWDEL